MICGAVGVDVGDQRLAFRPILLGAQQEAVAVDEVEQFHFHGRQQLDRGHPLLCDLMERLTNLVQAQVGNKSAHHGQRQNEPETRKDLGANLQVTYKGHFSVCYE
nr:hypothetical protein [Wenzhouxiangella limi]